MQPFGLFELLQSFFPNFTNENSPQRNEPEKSESENAPEEPPTTSATPNSAILQFMEEHEKRSKRSR